MSFVYPRSPHGVGLSDNVLANRSDTPGPGHDSPQRGGGASPSPRVGTPDGARGRRSPGGGMRSPNRKKYSAEGSATMALMVTANPTSDEDFEAFTTRLRVAIGGEFLDAMVADLAVQWTDSGRYTSTYHTSTYHAGGRASRGGSGVPEPEPGDGDAPARQPRASDFGGTEAAPVTSGRQPRGSSSLGQQPRGSSSLFGKALPGRGVVENTR